MISIIIPVYNQASKLAKCLDSILLQTYDNFEILIIDDGSTDNVYRVYEKYKSKFNLKIKYHRQENMGANSARNKGFSISRGEFLLFCDADIELRKDMLEKMHNFLKKNLDISYAYSSHYFGFKKFPLWDFDAKRLRLMPCIHTTSLMRRDSFPGFDESLRRLQDWDLWLTMLENNNRGERIAEYLFKVESGGTMSSWIPGFFYKLFPFMSKVKKYKQSMDIIKKKHNL